MRRTLIAIALLLSASAALADSAPTPDYSTDAILKILHEDDVKNSPFTMHLGRIDIDTPWVRFHLNYLPIMQSIPYAGPYGAHLLPNPFVLTGTDYAWRPGQYHAMADEYFSDPDYKREYNRVAKMLASQHIKINTH
jgi:hypothetical protein